MKKYGILLFTFFFYFFSLPLIAQQNEPAVRFANGNFTTGSNIKKQQFKKENIQAGFFGDQYFVLIQFDNLPGKQVKENLAKAGIALQEYLPGNTYMAGIKGSFDFAGARQWGITSINVMPAVYKINERLIK